MQKVDANSDGTVSWDEFCSYMFLAQATDAGGESDEWEHHTYQFQDLYRCERALEALHGARPLSRCHPLAARPMARIRCIGGPSHSWTLSKSRIAMSRLQLTVRSRLGDDGGCGCDLPLLSSPPPQGLYDYGMRARCDITRW